jgi:hypothetical protein
LKRKDLRGGNGRSGVGVEDAEEKNGECEEGIIRLAVGKMGYPGAEVARGVAHIFH